MVAPAIIGLGMLAAGVAGVILGKDKVKTLFAVVHIQNKNLVGKVFRDIKDAEWYQEQLSHKGRGSIIVQKVYGKTHKGGVYSSLHPVQAIAPSRMKGVLGAAFAIAPPGFWLVKWRAPGSVKEHIEVFEFEREAKQRESDLNQMQAWASTSMVPRTKLTSTKSKALTPIKRMASFKPPYDTKEAQIHEMLLTTRWPAAERFQRAKTGPYPETAIYTDNKEVQVPLFNNTVSSHEWRTSVETAPVADELMTKQPEMLTVVHALQDPG